MKFQLKLLIIVASLFAFAYAKVCTDEEWSAYKEEFNKSYKSTEDDMSHFYTYCDNKNAIDEHNLLYKSGESTYKLDVSALTDLNGEEIANYRRGSKKRTRNPSS